MSTYLIAEFYLWHGLAVCAVVGTSFVAGYYTAKRKLNSEQ